MRMYFGRVLMAPKDKEVFSFFRKNGISSDILLSMYQEGKEFSVFAKFREEKVLMDTVARLPTSIRFDYDNEDTALIAISVAGKQFICPHLRASSGGGRQGHCQRVPKIWHHPSHGAGEACS